VIVGTAQFQQTLWAVNTAVGAFLLLSLAIRKTYRAFPAFSLYILTNLVSGASAFFFYRRWGFSSPSSIRIAWGMQAVVICARAVAVTEVCRHALARYCGIWALGWRALLSCAGIVLVYSSLAAKRQWERVLPSADRGLELSIAATLVVLLVFARYYEVKVSSTDRSLAVGFCLYSCFIVVNNTILEHYLYKYVVQWNLLGMLAFLASLLLWTWALRKPQAEADPEEIFLPAGVYQTVAPQINLRLRLLNEQLVQFWKTEATRH
jgi:hypothetical protein